MSKWSPWIKIEQISTLDKLFKWEGVYEIRLSDLSGKAISIGRFLDADKEGLLMIGNSNSIQRRIKEFLNSSHGIIDRTRPHSEGDMLFIIKMLTRFQKSVYTNSVIHFKCRQLIDKAKAEKEEEKLLKNYFIKYGELPPLNCILPNRYIWDVKSKVKDLALNP